MNKEMLGTKELAEYLNINEKQVYKLIQAKKIPATRITGKWTFPKRLIDEWIIQNARENITPAQTAGSIRNHIVAMGSNDFSMDVLAHELSRLYPAYSISFSNVGSIGGLVALEQGICHIATSHLLDPDTGRYNTTCLKQYAPDVDVRLVTMAYRDLGLIVRPGNPHGIAGIADLAAEDITFINRQQGSGTRVFLDAAMKRMGITPDRIRGYDVEVDTHNETAIAVLGGSADAGLGVFAAAKMLGLDFICLTKERYDLVIPSNHMESGPVSAMLSIVRSEAFKKKIGGMGGYDTSDTGKTVAVAG